MKFTEKILEARAFAHEAHDAVGNKRRYTGEAYWTHVDRVADLAWKFTSDEAMTLGAEFHDILEEVTPLNSYYSLAKIEELFGKEVASYVDDLTERFTHASHPTLNRKARAALERDRLSRVQDNSKLIKICDVIDNTADIAFHDKAYAPTYLREKMLDLPVLFVEQYKDVWREAVDQVERLLQ